MSARAEYAQIGRYVGSQSNHFIWTEWTNWTVWNYSNLCPERGKTKHLDFQTSAINLDVCSWNDICQTHHTVHLKTHCYELVTRMHTDILSLWILQKKLQYTIENINSKHVIFCQCRATYTTVCTVYIHNIFKSFTNFYRDMNNQFIIHALYLCKILK